MKDNYCNRNCSNYKCRKNKNQEEKTKALNKKPLNYAEQYKKLIDLIESL